MWHCGSSYWITTLTYASVVAGISFLLGGDCGLGPRMRGQRRSRCLRRSLKGSLLDRLDFTVWIEKIRLAVWFWQWMLTVAGGKKEAEIANTDQRTILRLWNAVLKRYTGFHTPQLNLHSTAYKLRLCTSQLSFMLDTVSELLCLFWR